MAPTAGTYFYHSHVGLQLDRGLYGPLIIDPTHESMSYDQDYTLVLDDWLDGLPGTPDNAMKKLIAGGDRMGGMSGGMGDMAGNNVPPDIVYPLYLINGHSSDQPMTMSVAQGDKVRLRFIFVATTKIVIKRLMAHSSWRRA